MKKYAYVCETFDFSVAGTVKTVVFRKTSVEDRLEPSYVASQQWMNDYVHHFPQRRALFGIQLEVEEGKKLRILNCLDSPSLSAWVVWYEDGKPSSPPKIFDRPENFFTENPQFLQVERKGCKMVDFERNKWNFFSSPACPLTLSKPSNQDEKLTLFLAKDQLVADYPEGELCDLGVNYAKLRSTPTTITCLSKDALYPFIADRRELGAAMKMNESMELTDTTYLFVKGRLYVAKEGLELDEKERHYLATLDFEEELKKVSVEKAGDRINKNMDMSTSLHEFAQGLTTCQDQMGSMKLNMHGSFLCEHEDYDELKQAKAAAEATIARLEYETNSTVVDQSAQLEEKNIQLVEFQRCNRQYEQIKATMDVEVAKLKAEVQKQGDAATKSEKARQQLEFELIQRDTRITELNASLGQKRSSDEANTPEAKRLKTRIDDCENFMINSVHPIMSNFMIQGAMLIQHMTTLVGSDNLNYAHIREFMEGNPNSNQLVQSAAAFVSKIEDIAEKVQVEQTTDPIAELSNVSLENLEAVLAFTQG